MKNILHIFILLIFSMPLLAQPGYGDPVTCANSLYILDNCGTPEGWNIPYDDLDSDPVNGDSYYARLSNQICSNDGSDINYLCVDISAVDAGEEILFYAGNNYYNDDLFFAITWYAPTPEWDFFSVSGGAFSYEFSVAPGTAGCIDLSAFIPAGSSCIHYMIIKDENDGFTTGDGGAYPFPDEDGTGGTLGIGFDCAGGGTAGLGSQADDTYWTGTATGSPSHDFCATPLVLADGVTEMSNNYNSTSGSGDGVSSGIASACDINIQFTAETTVWFQYCNTSGADEIFDSYTVANVNTCVNTALGIGGGLGLSVLYTGTNCDDLRQSSLAPGDLLCDGECYWFYVDGLNGDECNFDVTFSTSPAPVPPPVDCPVLDYNFLGESTSVTVTRCDTPIDITAQAFLGMQLSLATDGWPDETSIFFDHDGTGDGSLGFAALALDPGDTGIGFANATDQFFPAGGTYDIFVLDSYGDALGCTTGAQCQGSNPCGDPGATCATTVPLANGPNPWVLSMDGDAGSGVIDTDACWYWDSENCGEDCGSNSIQITTAAYTNSMTITSSIDGVLASGTNVTDADIATVFDPATATPGTHTITYTFDLLTVNGTALTPSPCQVTATRTITVLEDPDITAVTNTINGNVCGDQGTDTWTAAITDPNPGISGINAIDNLDHYALEWFVDGVSQGRTTSTTLNYGALAPGICDPITYSVELRLICLYDDSVVETFVEGDGTVTVYPDPASFSVVVVTPPGCDGVTNGLVELRGTDGTAVCSSGTGTAGQDILVGCSSAQDAVLTWDFSGFFTGSPCPGLPVNVSGDANAGCICLSVELLTFTGEAVEQDNHLYWTTISETNNAYFDIERSVDGQRFTKIGKVTGNGTTIENTNYIFVDENPTTIAYYRLKQVDFNGDFEYSEVVEIRRSKDAEPKVFPNPTAGSIQVEFGASGSQTVEIQVTDVLGRTVSFEEIKAQSGINTHGLNIQGGTGVYFVSIIIGNNKYITKILKN